MNLLLDTHVFLWYVSGDQRLDSAVKSAIGAEENRVYLSVVSIWECLVKHKLGKLPLPHPPEEYLPEQRIRHAIESLPLEEACVQRLIHLPDLHRDPFDRMLICQAMQHRLLLVTVDEKIKQYPIEILH